MPRNLDFEGLYEELCYGFIRHKRAQGCEFPANSQFQLRKLARTLEEAEPGRIAMGEDTVRAFAARREGEKASTQRGRADVARQFALYLVQEGYEAYVLPPDQTPRESERAIPYIFSHDEIAAVIEAADSLPVSCRAPERNTVVPIAVRLLYSCGLRISEVTSLRVGDVDLDNGVLSVVKTKNGASRYVPMSDSMAESCRNYAASWERGDITPDTPFLRNRDGGAYSRSTLARYVQSLFAACGVLRADGTPPRVHDLRHSFAVHSFDRAYELLGMSGDACLPYLSAYLGHSHITDTEYYLQFTEMSRRRIVNSMIDVYSETGIGGGGHE